VRPVLSRTQMQQFDQEAVLTYKVASLLLMENAGRGAADMIRVHHPNTTRVLVCAGHGNNGGDGWVVARQLRIHGLDVSVLADAPRGSSGDASSMRQAYEALGGRVDPLTPELLEARLGELDPERSLLVDALFGTGLDRDVEGVLEQVILTINQSTLPVVSLDIPSGLDADTGRVLGRAVRATTTISFGHLKLGLLTPGGAEHTGHVEVVHIGVPGALVERVGYSARALELPDLCRALPERRRAQHKVDSGRVLVVAGSEGTLGAAHLTAHGALRAGAGLVSLLNRAAVVDKFEAQTREVMTARLDTGNLAASLEAHAANCHVLAMGPGLGVNATTLELVHAALRLECVKVLDADALSVLGTDLSALQAARGQLILTPHPGEAGRLLGTSASDVEANRMSALERLVAASGASVILKGAHTLIGAPGQLPVVSSTGSAVLAVGGSGDVLTGIIAALAVGGDAFRAAWLGAGLHGLCGDSWVARSGADRGLFASEIADELPRVFAQLAASQRTLTD